MDGTKKILRIDQRWSQCDRLPHAQLARAAMQIAQGGVVFECKPDRVEYGHHLARNTSGCNSVLPGQSPPTPLMCMPGPSMSGVMMVAVVLSAVTIVTISVPRTASFVLLHATTRRPVCSRLTNSLRVANLSELSRVLERIRLVRGISSTETSIHLETYRVA